MLTVNVLSVAQVDVISRVMQLHQAAVGVQEATMRLIFLVLELQPQQLER